MISYKIDKALLNEVGIACNGEKNVNAIVYFKSLDRAKTGVSLCGAQVVDEYPFISALGITGGKEAFLKLSTFTSVKYIASSAKVSTLINVAKKSINIQSLREKGLTGNGVTVAIIDTGVYEHLDFISGRNRIIYFKDFVNKKQNSYDDNGHGSFITGTLCGNGFASSGAYTGIAPNANIVALKAIGETGETGALTILAAMQWIYDNANTYNIKVVCCSFGAESTGKNDPLSFGVDALWRKGIVVVAAAGNNGPDAATILSPGTNSRIITVGAANDRDGVLDVAKFSSRGPALTGTKPDILAPGVDIIAANNFAKGSFYSKMSGTSVATPIVAGVVCLLLEKNPDLSPDAIKSRLLMAGNKIVYNKNSEGAGVLDCKWF